MYGVFRHRPREHRSVPIPVIFTNDLHITAGWDTTYDTNLMGYKSGLRLRKDDIANDFSFYSPYFDFNISNNEYRQGNSLVSQNTPPNTDYKYSRKNIRHNPGSEVDNQFFGPGRIEFNSRGVQAKLSQVDVWISAIYHMANGNAGATNGYYISQWYIEQALWGRDQTPTGGYYLPVMGGAEDCHAPYNPGYPIVFCENDSLTSFSYGANFTIPNNDWRKYTYTYDWVNQTFTLSINGTSMMDRVRVTTGGSWGTVASFKFTSGTFWEPASLGVENTIDREYINKWVEIFDRTISYRDTSFTQRPFTAYMVTNFCRLFLHTGTAIQTHTFETASENIQRINLSWTESVEEDTTITMEYGRSLPHDDPSLATALTEATGHPASACFDGNDSTYCESTGNTQDIIYHFSTAQTIAKVGIYLISTESTTYAFYGSADGETWSAALASGTYTPACTGSGQDIVIGSPASYEYFKVSCATASTVIKIGNIQLREPVASHNTSAAASIVVQTRVSTDSGVNWSAWTAHTSGNNIADITNPSVYTTLQVQTKMIFNTENPRYQPVMSQMLLDVYGVSDNVTADIQLKIQGEGKDALTTIPGCLVGGSALVSEQQSSLVN